MRSLEPHDSAISLYLICAQKFSPSLSRVSPSRQDCNIFLVPALVMQVATQKVKIYLPWKIGNSNDVFY
jgi:hypothetical protein